GRRIDMIQREIHEYYWNYKVTKDLIELRNITTVAKLIVQSARARKESRGLHFTLDYPETQDAFLKDTVLVKA
ncbi:MAG: L-aspartate oxidase, partial [Smithellaceae bacterium]|nr:L-aspartate oxidase [Smithellaceae bacterium]